MTRNRRLVIWAVRVAIGLFVAVLCACGAAHSTGPSAQPPSAGAVVSAGATDLNSALAAVHASPEGTYAVQQVSQCPGMTNIGSFFVTTTQTNKIQVDEQRVATIAYMRNHSNREKVYTCLGTKFNMTKDQEKTLASCVEPKANAAYKSQGHLVPTKAEIISTLQTALLTYVPQCYTVATGRKLTPPAATPSPSPSSNGT